MWTYLQWSVGLAILLWCVWAFMTSYNETTAVTRELDRKEQWPKDN